MITLKILSFHTLKLSVLEPQQEGESCGSHMGPRGKCAPGLECKCIKGKLSGRHGCGQCVKPSRPMYLGYSNLFVI